MNDKITIIEGPAPVFEPVQDGWAMGLSEGPLLGFTVLTRLRTLNGPALVERCYRAWRDKSTIRLHYRNPDGLEEQTPIVAVRAVETQEGHVLMLWLNFDSENAELEFDGDDLDDADFDE